MTEQQRAKQIIHQKGDGDEPSPFYRLSEIKDTDVTSLANQDCQLPKIQRFFNPLAIYFRRRQNTFAGGICTLRPCYPQADTRFSSNSACRSPSIRQSDKQSYDNLLSHSQQYPSSVWIHSILRLHTQQVAKSPSLLSQWKTAAQRTVQKIVRLFS